MAKYRKKPVIIDAWQFNGWEGKSNHETWSDDVPDWIVEAEVIHGMAQPGQVRRVVTSGNIQTLEIYTAEGIMTAQVADWIIRGVQGELYPCKPDIFAQTYEAA